ncbi:MAG: hypothetical protein H7647_09585 [Candidatus Heimdallarchaeota archaeon]|nr:hypothetical protein [Candidatus Heimdallarchaeota archaeon]MCK4254680.1 hypothetical protein [Candidatus Heimdallarchaeota archaeon]
MLKPAIISELQLERIENTEEGIIFAQKRILELENDLLLMDELLNKSLFLLIDILKDKQHLIFTEAIKQLDKRSFSLNKLAEILSLKLDFTFSMIKWNLTKFRDYGLFESNGQRGNTKSTLLLTELGRMLYSTFAKMKTRKL